MSAATRVARRCDECSLDATSVRSTRRAFAQRDARSPRDEFSLDATSSASVVHGLVGT